MKIVNRHKKIWDHARSSKGALTGLMFTLICHTSNAAQSISVQGRLLNADGSAVTSSAVQFTIKVKSPGVEDCLLYQETQTLNLSQTAGAFALTLGAGTRVASTVDGGNPLNAVFSNSGAISLTSAPSACANSATSFTPATADTRNLEITFNDGSGVDSIPTIPLAWTPQSIYSQDAGKLAGVNATQYLKVASGTTPATFSAGDYSNLAALLNGSSTQYMSSSTTNGTVIPNLGSAPSSPSAGQMWFDSVSNTIKYYNGTATQTIGTSTGLSSVGLTMPAIFSVSGSPLISNGSITTTLANQSANTVFAGPSSGGAAAPTFRAIAAADLPTGVAGGIIKDGGNSLGAAMTLGTNDANSLGLKTNNSTRMTIDSSGNVGIGTTSPIANLDVVGTSQFGKVGPSSPTTINAAVLSTDTTITVVSTAGYPSSGILYITDTTNNEEAVSYTGKTATTFTGLTRGLYTSTARAWAVGNIVDLVTQVVAGANNTTAPRIFYTQTRGIGYGRLPASLLFVIFLTFISARYKEEVIHDVVLNKDRDERESLISGLAAKKSILITLAASLLILLCTTGQYNKAETIGKSSLTIGHFRLTDNATTTTQGEDGSTIVHYQLPMSKMSLVLLLILIQLSSFHAIKFINLRKMEV